MKKKIVISKKFLARVLAVVTSYIIPFAAFAQGIIPCGPGSPTEESCQLMHLPELINNIMDLLMTIVVPLSVIFFAIGGVVMMFAPIKEDNIKKGKSYMVTTLWGLLVFFCSWIIVKAILVAVGFDNAFSWVNLV